MIILCVRADKPEAELAVYDGATTLKQTSWQAHRELSDTLHVKIKDTLQGLNKKISDIDGIIVYKGPGSFTGLRISVSVANALAYSLPAKIVGTSGDKWVQNGIQLLQAGANEQAIMPEYGSSARTTKPRK